MEFKRILLPLDGSKNSEQTIDYALRIAEDEHAELILLNVVDSKRFTSLPDDAFNQDSELIFEKEGQRVLDKAKNLIIEKLEEDRADIKVSTLVIEGNPSETILKASQIKEADLIVIATSGKHMVNRFLLGSVTEKIIRQSKVPVLVVPPLDKNN